VGVGYILWASVVHSYVALLIVYVGIIALGVNGGFFHPALAVANNWFIRRRALAMAVISTAVGVGGAIIVPIVGYVIDNFGWRPMAMGAGVFLLVFIWPLVLFIRHSPEDVGLLPDGDKPKNTVGESQDGDIASRYELDGQDEMGEVTFSLSEAFHTRAMWILIAGITLRFTSHTAIMVHLAPILQAQGMSTTKAGAAIGLLVFLSIPGRIVVGFLGDRFSKHRVVASLLVLQCLAMVVLYGANSTFALYLFIVLWAAAYGAGILNWAIVGDYFGRARFATLRGLMGLVYSWGAVIGPVYAGWIYDKNGDYSIAIGVFLVVTVLSMVCFWFCTPPGLPQSYRFTKSGS
jgi:MFS family permease